MTPGERIAEADRKLREEGRAFAFEVWTRHVHRALGQEPTAPNRPLCDDCYILRLREEQLEHFWLEGDWDVRQTACSPYLKTVALILFPSERMIEQLIWFKLKFETPERKVIYKYSELESSYICVF